MANWEALRAAGRSAADPPAEAKGAAEWAAAAMVVVVTVAAARAVAGSRS